MSLTDQLLHHAARFPQRPALEFEGAITTWAELLDGTRRTAGALEELGVRPGAVVALLLHNSDRFLELMHAISHVGAIVMPLNWRLAPTELSYIVNHSGATLLVSEPELEGLVEPVREELPCALARASGPSHGAWLALDEAAATTAPRIEPAAVSPDDLCRLMYTSGTTSHPKGVMITYANLWAKNVGHMAELGMTEHAIGLACGPLYHVGALDLTTSTLMYVGATNHVLRRFDATGVLAAIEHHRITDVWLAPAMINLLLAHPDSRRRDLTSVRLIVGGGEKMPLTLIERVQETFPNAWFADAYGLTETVSGDTFLDKSRTIAKRGSVGTPVLHTTVRIARGDGETCAAGEPGEVLLRGPKVCKGYWRDEAATAAAIREGWLHTGDLGLLDDDGHLFIVDRIKDLIVSGGENIASSEVERVLYEHPAVLEAAVVGRPHQRWLEVPVAYVVLCHGLGADAPSAEQLSEHCRARLARFKVPHAVRFVARLPRNPSGKVLKRELRDREIASVENSMLLKDGETDSQGAGHALQGD